MDEDKLAFEEELDELVAKFIHRRLSLLDISSVMELKLYTVNETIGQDQSPLVRLVADPIIKKALR